MSARFRLASPADFARGAGAFVFTDVITGMAAYCVITLVALWYFSTSWIRLSSWAASRGVALGTGLQLDLAWVGAVVALPTAGLVIYLAYRAYGLPKDVLRTGGHQTFRDLRSAVSRR